MAGFLLPSGAHQAFLPTEPSLEPWPLVVKVAWDALPTKQSHRVQCFLDCTVQLKVDFPSIFTLD